MICWLIFACCLPLCFCLLAPQRLFIFSPYIYIYNVNVDLAMRNCYILRLLSVHVIKFFAKFHGGRAKRAVMSHGDNCALNIHSYDNSLRLLFNEIIHSGEIISGVCIFGYILCLFAVRTRRFILINVWNWIKIRIIICSRYLFMDVLLAHLFCVYSLFISVFWSFFFAFVVYFGCCWCRMGISDILYAFKLTRHKMREGPNWSKHKAKAKAKKGLCATRLTTFFPTVNSASSEPFWNTK